MPVSLQKGQKVELRKSTGGELTRVIVGLGWDEVKITRGFFLKKNQQDIDCDASAFLLQNDVLMSSQDVVYFGNLTHKSGCVNHMGDNLTGGTGEKNDDEQIIVDLQRLPMSYNKIVFVVNIYQARERRQHFGMLQNAYIRICDDGGQELCRYPLNENYQNMTAMIFGELYRYNGVWKFNAIGQPTVDNSVSDLAERYR